MRRGKDSAGRTSDTGGGSMTVKILYICDKQAGACDWSRNGWKRCENDMCFHTSNKEHAKTGGTGIMLRAYSNKKLHSLWEVTCRCYYDNKCAAQLEDGNKKYCIDGNCPIGKTKPTQTE